MKTEEGSIRFILAITLFPVLLMNGMHYMMPYDAINVYEYLSGDSLSSYHLVNIFTGSAVMPLVALITGYMLNHWRDRGILDLGKITITIFLAGSLQSVFVFAWDFLPGLALTALVGLIFLKSKWFVPMISAVLLFAFHMAANVLPDILENIGSPTDKMYSAIQTVNEQTSVYRSSDYFAIISKNIEIFTGDIPGMVYTLLFTVLPWLLFGMALSKVGIKDLLAANHILAVAMFITLAGGGLALKLIQVVTLGTYSGTLLADNFGGPVLALGYFILLLFISAVIPEKAVALFAPLGGRVLTMYIAGNILLIFIFYGIGFTAYGDVSILSMVLIMTAVYVLSVAVGFLFRKAGAGGIETLFADNSDKCGEN
ncbi:DUF418 domain-containing protein [Salinicoccus carnicancri]|uniref:DUF418 domain-containing protein n=1 Tax=Salinicoccus carnicancri TaxID=558170 RepID=UPI0002FAA610|nr:DUF418 domain-containing protein [Salinicoccus carnicancri]